MKPLPLVDGNTLLLDNSRLERIMYCMREAQHAVLERRLPVDDDAALIFGGAVHLAQKLRYSYGPGLVTPQIEARQMLLLEKLWEIKPTPFDNWRNLGLCQDLIHLYNQTYAIEPFGMFTNSQTGKYIIEEPFSLPLGKVGDIKVMWIGKIDLPVKEGEDTWVMDHKTSSVGGDMALAGMQNSSQFKGYCWAFNKRFGIRPKGAIVNLMIARKPAKIKGKGNEVLRQKIWFDEDTITEWENNTLHLVGDYISCHERGYFPMMTTQCVRKYGRCDYAELCALSPTTRRAQLDSNVFYDDTWSPLHEDAIDIEEFRAIPDDQLTAWKPPSKKTTELPYIEDLLNI